MEEIDGFRVRRAYEQPVRDDGKRVLVDRLWPRGLSKDHAALDAWAKEVAPTNELRHWYGHDPERYEEFRRRYLAELDDQEHTEALERLRGLTGNGPVTLLTATKEVERSHLPTLAHVLAERATK